MIWLPKLRRLAENGYFTLQQMIDAPFLFFATFDTLDPTSTLAAFANFSENACTESFVEIFKIAIPIYTFLKQYLVY